MLGKLIETCIRWNEQYPNLVKVSLKDNLVALTLDPDNAKGRYWFLADIEDLPLNFHGLVNNAYVFSMGADRD